MYAKLFTSIYQGTLRGNSNALLVFTNLLAHADSVGEVDMHPRAIAEEVGLSMEQVKSALDTLEAPDDESRTPDEGGRRIVRLDAHRAWGWRVVNHAKYRAIRSEEDRREQNRAAQERWREKNKQSKPASAEPKQKKPRKPRSANTEADTEANTKNTNTGPSAPRSARSVSVNDLETEGVEKQHAVDWLKARGKVPLTHTAWAAIKTQAGKAGITPAEAVRIAAENAWRGFKADWLLPKTNGRPEPGSTVGHNPKVEATQRLLREQAEQAKRATAPPPTVLALRSRKPTSEAEL